MNFEIIKLSSEEDACECAVIMSTSEPWTTLNRDYEQSLKSVKDELSEVYVMKSENQLVGFVIIHLKGQFVGYIKTIALKSGYRGKGLGTKLIEFLEELIFKKYPNVFICVSSFNPRARKLYESLGYEYVGELKDFIVTGYSEIILRKTIGPIMGFPPS